MNEGWQGIGCKEGENGKRGREKGKQGGESVKNSSIKRTFP